MSFAAALLLAAAAAQAAPADAPRQPDRGAEVETAQVRATILRSAVLKSGSLASSQSDAPRSQRHAESGRITYTFE
ncbi:MAG: hypothetical protein J2O44_08485 [Porphyrobacter sp.]|nr:hypothetical protein [Porphyrobacter sp.]